MAVRDGQYFTIGMMLLAGLLLTVLIAGTQAPPDATSDLSQVMFDNSMEEFPEAVRQAVDENTTSSTVEREIRQYIEFQQYTLGQYNMEPEAHVLIGLPTDDGYNLTFGNYRDETMNEAWLHVDGVTRQLGTVEPGTIETRQFPSQERTIDLRFNTTDRNLTLQASRRTVSYIDMRVEVGEAVWRETSFN